MNLRRVLPIAAGLFLFAALPAVAQFQPQQPAAAAASPWDQQPQGLQGIPGISGVQQGPTPDQQRCVEEFGKLRDAAQKRALAIRNASERKVQAKEACGLFNAFSDAELKMIKFATDSQARCGIPPEVVKSLKQGHVKSSELRTKVCQAAAAPMQPAAPSLSDALGSRAVPDANNIKTGRGTFDTLTGTPLGSNK